jgi:hypothetical protein
MKFFENMRAGIEADIVAFHPTSWGDVEDAFQELFHISMVSLGGGFRHLGMTLGPDRKPYTAAFGAFVAELSKHHEDVAQGIVAAQGIVESAHEAELKRIRAPRPDEIDLDVERNLNRG